MAIIRLSTGQEYNFVYMWEDLTLAKAQKVSHLKADVPDKYIEAQRSRIKGKEITAIKILSELSKEDQKTVLLIYRRAIELLSDIPKKLILLFSEEQIRDIFDKYVYHIVMGIWVFPYSQTSAYVKYVSHRGKKYYLPESKIIFDKVVPMADVSIYEFTESADLQISASKEIGREFDYMANIISILARPKGEKYDEQKSLKRAEIFQDISMDKAWTIFFMLTQTIQYIKESRQVLFRNPLKYKKGNKSNIYGWYSLIIEVAETGIMGTLEKVKDANLYEFLDVLAVKREQALNQIEA